MEPWMLMIVYGVGWLMGSTTMYFGLKRDFEDALKQLQRVKVRDLNGRNDQR